MCFPLGVDLERNGGLSFAGPFFACFALSLGAAPQPKTVIGGGGGGGQRKTHEVIDSAEMIWVDFYPD